MREKHMRSKIQKKKVCIETKTIYASEQYWIICIILNVNWASYKINLSEKTNVKFLTMKEALIIRKLNEIEKASITITAWQRPNMRTKSITIVFILLFLISVYNEYRTWQIMDLLPTKKKEQKLSLPSHVPLKLW